MHVVVDADRRDDTVGVGATGSVSTRWFQALEAGKTGHAGAPGSLAACAASDAEPERGDEKMRAAILRHRGGDAAAT